MEKLNFPETPKIAISPTEYMIYKQSENKNFFKPTNNLNFVNFKSVTLLTFFSLTFLPSSFVVNSFSLPSHITPFLIPFTLI